MATLNSTLYLSTTSTSNPPLAFTDKANVSWLVDWDNLFHGRSGLCKVHTNLISKSATVGAITTSWSSLIGTVRANLQSNYSLNQNGLVLANMNPNCVGVSTTVLYFSAVSEGSKAPLINIPEGKSTLNIQLMDMTETAFISGMPEYEIMLVFEWVSHDVINKSITK